jgi:hypothetical protein
MNSANQSVVRAAEPYALAQYPSKSNMTLAIFVFPSQRHRMIAQAAYYRAERRGFQPGRELDDWLCAEREVNSACGFL